MWRSPGNRVSKTRFINQKNFKSQVSQSFPEIPKKKKNLRNPRNTTIQHNQIRDIRNPTQSDQREKESRDPGQMGERAHLTSPQVQPGQHDLGHVVWSGWLWVVLFSMTCFYFPLCTHIKTVPIITHTHLKRTRT